MNERNYNVTGKERKALVNKVVELTGEKPVYLGMPTVAFKVGPFEISRSGILTWEEYADESAQQLIKDLRNAGFKAEGDEELGESDDQEAPIIDEGQVESVEAEPESMEQDKEIGIIAEPVDEQGLNTESDASKDEPELQKQHPVNNEKSSAESSEETPEKGTEPGPEGLLKAPEAVQDGPQGPENAGMNKYSIEGKPQERAAKPLCEHEEKGKKPSAQDDSDSQQVIPQTSPLAIFPASPQTTSKESSQVTPQDENPKVSADQLTISLPDNLSDTQFLLLKRLVEGKETLFKHAFQTDSLEIIRADGKISFPWFKVTDSNHTKAYTEFLTHLVKMAKNAKRVVVRDKPVDNEKFSFRVFLIRLDLIGNKYKAARKILLENLTGNSAWKNGAPTTTVNLAPQSAEVRIIPADDTEHSDNIDTPVPVENTIKAETTTNAEAER